MGMKPRPAKPVAPPPADPLLASLGFRTQAEVDSFRASLRRLAEAQETKRGEVVSPGVSRRKKRRIPTA